MVLFQKATDKIEDVDKMEDVDKTEDVDRIEGMDKTEGVEKIVDMDTERESVSHLKINGLVYLDELKKTQHVLSMEVCKFWLV